MIKTLFLAALVFFGAAHSAPALAATVEGSVRDLKGQPLVGATVYSRNMERSSGGSHRISTVTDYEGKFVLRDLSTGSYEIHAYKESEGYADTFFAFYGINNKAFRVVYVNGRSTINVVLTLGPKCARLKVSIRNEEGKPLGGGLTFVRVNAPGAPYSLGANADSELLVPPVPFRFEVSATGYQPWKSGIMKLHPGETTGVTVHVKRSG